MNVLKCPGCHKSENIGKLEVNGQLAVCRTCSKSKRAVFYFCTACQREWPHNVSITKSCTLPNCALRAALLSTKLIEDPRSSVNGCPYFRACPGCTALLTHNGRGCPDIICPTCETEFCFRCMDLECYDDDEYYDSDLDDSDLEMKPCVLKKNSDILQQLGL